MPAALLQFGAIVLFLGGLIFVHELGHFLVAKALGVKVLRFSIGFGPRAFGFRRGETEYWIAFFPLGGYVKMAGEIGDEADPVAPEDRGRGFLEQSPLRRLLISVAGPAASGKPYATSGSAASAQKIASSTIRARSAASPRNP